MERRILTLINPTTGDVLAGGLDDAGVVEDAGGSIVFTLSGSGAATMRRASCDPHPYLEWADEITWNVDDGQIFESIPLSTTTTISTSR